MRNMKRIEEQFDNDEFEREQEIRAGHVERQRREVDYETKQFDDYDRAVSMINAAVEEHMNKDQFDKIADIDSLVNYLKGRHHDFTPKVEQNVRDIIADELGYSKDDFRAEEEEHRSKFQKKRSPSFYQPEDKKKFPYLDRFKRSPSRYRNTLARSARSEEEEKQSSMFKNLRKWELDFDPRGWDERRRPKPKKKSWREEEEQRQWERDFDPRIWPDQPKEDRVERPKTSKKFRKKRSSAWLAPPFDYDAEYDDRIWDSKKSEEQEAKDSGYHDWNKEVYDFRKRRRTVEPEFARQPSRLRKQRKTAPSRGPFNLPFEGFKQFNEMYRDSQHGLTIDLSGPDGNAFVLMGYVKNLAKQLGKDATAILDEMTASDYNHLIEVFEREFGDVVTLLNKPEE